MNRTNREKDEIEKGEEIYGTQLSCMHGCMYSSVPTRIYRYGYTMFLEHWPEEEEQVQAQFIGGKGNGNGLHIHSPDRFSL